MSEPRDTPAREHVTRLSDIWGEALVPCKVGDEAVFLVRFGEVVVAYRDRCPHLGVPLSEGKLVGTTLTCRAHCYEFDVLTGLGINPTGVALDRFAVRIEGDEVHIARADANGAPA